MLLTLAVLTTFLPHPAHAKSQAEIWKETNLTFAELRKLVNDDFCLQNKLTYLACALSVNSVLTHRQPAPLALVPAVRIGQDWKLAAVYKDFGALKVVPEYHVEPLDAQNELEVHAHVKFHRNEDLLYWSKGFDERERGDHAPISFTPLLDWAQQEILNPETEGLVTAEAINTFLSVISDPHTRILPIDSDEDSPQFSGIGAMLRLEGRRVIVRYPFEDSPALAAGIHGKDVVVAIDGRSTDDLMQPFSTRAERLTAIANALRGDPGTTVHVRVLRHDKILSFAIVRSKVGPLLLTPKMLHDRKHLFGYLRLASFSDAEFSDWLRLYNKKKEERKKDPIMSLFPDLGEPLCPHMPVVQAMRNAVAEMKARGAYGIILDLRDNPGGLVVIAKCVANVFLPPNQFVATLEYDSGVVDNQGNQKDSELYITEDPAATDLPMVTLVNGSTASAAEIVAGALQDHQRSYILGERTYGKGTVQDLVSVFGPDVKVAEYLTEGYYHLPTGRTPQLVGIEPDFTVHSAPHPSPSEIFATREADDYINPKEPQGSRWTQPRPDEIGLLQKCVERTTKAEKIWNDRQDDAIPPDFQMLSAQDAMECVIDHDLQPEHKSLWPFAH